MDERGDVRRRVAELADGERPLGRRRAFGLQRGRGVRHQRRLRLEERLQLLRVCLVALDLRANRPVSRDHRRRVDGGDAPRQFD